MNIRSRISMALLAVLLLNMLVSCAKSADNTDAGVENDEIQADTGTEVVPETEAPEYVSPDKSYDGANFTVCSNEWVTSPWTINKHIEVYCEEDSGDPIDTAIFRRNSRIEEELNVKFSFYPIEAQSSTNEILIPIRAGDLVYQFALPNATSLPTIISDGSYVYDLRQVGSLNLDASWWDSKSLDATALYGKNYMVTGDLCFYTKAAPVILYYNKGIAEDYHISSPYIVDDNEGYDKSEL